MIAPMSDGGILQDQIDYYRARAGEYDEWWFRTGRYDRGPEFNARWRAEVATVEAALDTWLTARRPQTLLELACGTGLFTRRLAPRVTTRFSSASGCRMFLKTGSPCFGTTWRMRSLPAAPCISSILHSIRRRR